MLPSFWPGARIAGAASAREIAGNPENVNKVRKTNVVIFEWLMTMTRIRKT
jgi:hypothetical protein